MINQKSVDSYHKLLEEGTINKRQSQVYEVILHLGKCTNRQIAKALDWDINRVTGRVKELRDKNLVEYAGDSFDSSTNRTVNLWQLKERKVLNQIFEGFAKAFTNHFNLK